jgi:hypothetical protein
MEKLKEKCGFGRVMQLEVRKHALIFILEYMKGTKIIFLN